MKTVCFCSGVRAYHEAIPTHHSVLDWCKRHGYDWKVHSFESNELHHSMSTPHNGKAYFRYYLSKYNFLLSKECDGYDRFLFLDNHNVILNPKLTIDDILDEGSWLQPIDWHSDPLIGGSVELGRNFAKRVVDYWEVHLQDTCEFTMHYHFPVEHIKPITKVGYYKKWIGHSIDDGGKDRSVWIFNKGKPLFSLWTGDEFFFRGNLDKTKETHTTKGWFKLRVPHPKPIPVDFVWDGVFEHKNRGNFIP